MMFTMAFVVVSAVGLIHAMTVRGAPPTGSASVTAVAFTPPAEPLK